MQQPTLHQIYVKEIGINSVLHTDTDQSCMTLKTEGCRDKQDLPKIAENQILVPELRFELWSFGYQYFNFNLQCIVVYLKYRDKLFLYLFASWSGYRIVIVFFEQLI